MNYPKTTKVCFWLYGLASEENGSLTLTVDAGKPAPSWQHVNFTPLVPRACAWLAYWLHMENFNKKTWKSTLWCQPIFKHIIKAKWIISPNRDENKKYLSCHHLELIHQLHQSKHRWPLPPNPEAVSWQSIAFYLRGMVHLVVQCKKNRDPNHKLTFGQHRPCINILQVLGILCSPSALVTSLHHACYCTHTHIHSHTWFWRSTCHFACDE